MSLLLKYHELLPIVEYPLIAGVCLCLSDNAECITPVSCMIIKSPSSDMREVNILSKDITRNKRVLQGYKDWNPFPVFRFPSLSTTESHVASLLD